MARYPSCVQRTARPTDTHVRLVGRVTPCAPSYVVSGLFFRNDDSTVRLTLSEILS
jgi:hypothetical protein